MDQVYRYIYNIYVYIPDQAAELLGARELSPQQLVAWIEGKRGEASTARPRKLVTGNPAPCTLAQGSCAAST